MKCFIDSLATVFYLDSDPNIKAELSDDFNKIYPSNINFYDTDYRS
jgi:hypothetical protein